MERPCVCGELKYWGYLLNSGVDSLPSDASGLIGAVAGVTSEGSRGGGERSCRRCRAL